MPITPTNPNSPKFADTDSPFLVTLTTAGTAEDVVTVPASKKGRIVSLINEGPGDIALAFDATATPAGLVIRAGEAYSESALEIGTKISFINVTPLALPVVRGVLWSGPA